MMNSECSGVGFSRHPLKPLSSDASLIEAVYGLGEGLVSGLLEADRYEVWSLLLFQACISRFSKQRSYGNATYLYLL